MPLAAAGGEELMGQETRVTPTVLAPTPDPGPGGATHVRYRVLAAGCALAVLTYIQRLGFTSGLPEIDRDFHLGTERLGYLSAVALVAYGAFQVPGGLLGDRLGARNLLTILVLSWSLLTGAVALTAFLPTVVVWQFSLLLLLRFLFAMFQAGGFPVWARVVADWMPRSERGLAQGMMWTFSRLGGALSPFIFLGLFKLFHTWTTPFFYLAALGVLWCGVFWPWFRNRPEEMEQVNEAERRLIAAGRTEPGGISAGRGPVPWKRMLGSGSVWGLCFMYGFVGFSGNFITSLLPQFLRNQRKLSEDATARVFGLTLTSGLVACVLGGFLSDWIIRRTGSRKWGRRLNGSIGLVFAGLACLAIPSAKEVWLLGILFCAFFFFNDMIMGPAWASCADIGERHAGTLSGAMNMTGAFAGAGGAALAGILLEADQEGLLFGLFAVSYALAALCWLAVDVTRPLVEKP
jgi:sugar phosphate permease